MKCVILAGGMGTRIMEKTQTIPKPLLEVNGKPLLQHIINIYRQYGVDEFIIAGGYKIEDILVYFGADEFNAQLWGKSEIGFDWFKDFGDHRVWIVNTGINTLTGSRIKKLQPFMDPHEPFMLTYGDGLSDVNLDNVLSLHFRRKAIVTMTVVRPEGRFGRVVMNNVYGNVIKFGEKIESQTDWINGGFMVIDPSIFKYIPDGDNVNLEKDVIPLFIPEDFLYGYQHRGFWKSVDTMRDLLDLQEITEKDGEVWLKKTK